MKNNFLIVCFLLASFSGWAQIDFVEEESFFNDRQIFIPSLSQLSPEFPESTIELREVDFTRKRPKLQVDMVAMMEQEKMRSPRHIELEAPFQKPERDDNDGVNFELSDGVRAHSRGWNYDPYTGKSRNPAYGEYERMRNGLFNGYYRPRFGSRYYSPYGRYYR